MRLLLDTHVFLWVVTDSRKLKQVARQAILAAEEVHVSAASIWEIAIKAGLGRLVGDAQAMLDAIAASGFRELPVSGRHAAAVQRLPSYHGDPFDRLLIAQAIAEPLHLMTADPTLTRYSELVQVV
jgi:PIN domain nuclease of toxin-antitoxin system